MICALFDIVLFIVGIAVLMKGEVAYTSARVLRGWAAYLFGGVLMLTLPLAAVVAIPIAVNVSKRQPVNWQTMSPHLLFCSFLAGVICLLLALMIAMFGTTSHTGSHDQAEPK